MSENSNGMSTLEVVGIGAAALLVMGLMYVALKPKKNVAIIPPSNKPSFDADNLGDLAQYAIDEKDLLAATHLMTLVGSLKTFDDGSGGGFASWWLGDIPLYMPGGDRDNSTFFNKEIIRGGNYKIGGQIPLTIRLMRATNELYSQPEWQQSGADVATFNLANSYLSHAMIGV
jgi:hypothetical protein